MTSSALTVTVLAQIVVFQLIPILLTRGLFRTWLGTPPPSVAADLDRHLRDSSRSRSLLGAILLVVAVGGGLLEPGTAIAAPKILLTVVSLTSSAAFVVGLARDRRVLRSLEERLPDASIRVASLRRRTLSLWYRPAWELVPVAVLLATAALTMILQLRAGPLREETWLLLLLQAVFVVVGLSYAVQRGPAVPRVPVRPDSGEPPEAALRLGQALLRREMRAFLLARSGAALLLGTAAVGSGLEATGHPAAVVVDTITWIVVTLLLVVFAAYVVGAARRLRRAPVPRS